MARPQVPRPQGESLLLAKDTRAPPDTLPSRRGAGLFPQSRDQPGTPHSGRKSSAANEAPSRLEGGVPRWSSREATTLQREGLRFHLLWGRQARPPWGRCPRTRRRADTAKHLKTEEWGRVPSCRRRTPERGCGQELELRRERKTGRSSSHFRLLLQPEKPRLLQNRDGTVLLDVPPGCRREKRGVFLR